MSSPPTSADPLADAAVADIRPGMVVGLGTGKTAARGVFALAERVRAERLDIRCVPTSHATESQARALGLLVVDFSMVEEIDFLFDGADEVDPDLRMIKGRGGAIVRERVVAKAAKRCLYMITEEKLVEHLGQRSSLPIAVHYFALASVRKRLIDLGFNGVVRRTLSGDHFLTDQGNLVIDVSLPQTISPEECKLLLDATAGVVDHGLFLDEADEVLIQMPDSRIERMERPS